MKRRDVLVLLALTVTVNLFTSCGSVANLTGDKIIKKDNNHLIVQSNVEMINTNINSQTAGKIKEIKVKEGITVKKGQVLITIDSDSLVAQRAQIQAQIQAVNGQLNATKAARDAAILKLEKEQNGARPEEISQAKESYEFLRATYDRTKSLYDSGFSAKAELDNASTQLKIAKSKYELLQSGSRAEDIGVARVQVEQANASVESMQGQLNQAEASLQGIEVNVNNTTITAPTDGVITQLNVKSGELVTTGMPLMVIANDVIPSIQCNIKETDLPKVKLDRVVSVKIPAYPDKSFKGTVVRINKNADFAVKRATNDNGEFDILSYGVKVELTDITKPINAGMTAFVDFGKK